MFSEYASRFLAQSQSRLYFTQQRDSSPSGADASASRRGIANHNASSSSSSRNRFLSNRANLGRPAMPGPYQQTGASNFGRFPFAQRPAPLFYSATDDFRDDDVGDEHERDVADLYALQQSRRQFGGSGLTDSSEVEDRHSQGAPARREPALNARRQPLKAGWTDPNNDDVDDDESDDHEHDEVPDDLKYTVSPIRGRPGQLAVQRDQRNRLDRPNEVNKRNDAIDDAGETQGRGRLVDVELASTMHGSVEDLGRGEEADTSGRPGRPSYQPELPSAESTPRAPQVARFLPRPTEWTTRVEQPRPADADGDAIAAVARTLPDYAKHDAFWSSLYLISLASLLATYLLVFLHTSAPDKHHPIGDTIYTVLQSSGYLLGTYTIVSATLSLIWFAALRYFVRPLALVVIVVVPLILFTFFLYPHVASYQGAWHGASFQDRAIRWLSLVPLALAVLWIYTIYHGRHSVSKGLDILGFAGRTLAANASLVYVALANLATVILWTWVWKSMFARVFLAGHLSKSKSLFILNGSSWWLGAYFTIIYVWTLSILSGLQRAVAAAAVSDWYFHRTAVAAPASRTVVQASVGHATGPMFGTVCLSTLLALAVRLPLIILPARLAGILSLAVYSLVPLPLTTLTNPLTLTYAAVHSQPLGPAARGLAQLSFLSSMDTATTALTPAAVAPSSSRHTAASLMPYRLAKLLLHASRLVMSLSLGLGGWVTAARAAEVAGAGVRGSLYAYVVGLVAAAIGWAVLGATEGLLAAIVDALIVCWASEVRANKNGGEARYCREANELFGGKEPWGP